MLSVSAVVRLGPVKMTNVVSWCYPAMADFMMRPMNVTVLSALENVFTLSLHNQGHQQVSDPRRSQALAVVMKSSPRVRVSYLL